MDDVRTRRSPVKMAFNFAQYTISMAAARLVFARLTGQPFLAAYTPFRPHDLIPTLLAGFAFLIINNGLVAIVVALDTGEPVIEMLRDDLAFKMETSAVLVGLSGVAAVLAQFSGWMLPLLAMPVLAVRRSAVLAAARQTQAMRDALTGLGNRALFFSRADKLLARFERSGESVAVLMIDLDHFKDINDTLGHQVGDRVIQAVAGRIAHLGGDLGCVARLGGDEFAVALSRGGRGRRRGGRRDPARRHRPAAADRRHPDGHPGQRRDRHGRAERRRHRPDAARRHRAVRGQAGPRPLVPVRRAVHPEHAGAGPAGRPARGAGERPAVGRLPAAGRAEPTAG